GECWAVMRLRGRFSLKAHKTTPRQRLNDWGRRIIRTMSASEEPRYQVFISSTSKDLHEERQKALQAVLEMKAFPTGMEMFPSADDEQWDFIKREIESSDYYVVIVAG